MEIKRQRRIRLLLCILLVVILAAAVSCWDLLKRCMVEVSNDEVFSISLDSGFYTEDQKLIINMPRGTAVYYTDNCELPDRENGVQYTAPIFIKASEEEKIYVYRFKAYNRDGTESEILTRTYFMGTNIDERYTTKVLHITGEPEGLFGYENGIFASGGIFDEFVRKNPGVHYGGGVDANYTQKGKDWEREVYIQYFDTDGTELLAQNGGIRINGHATRMKNQKSFRLYARREYDVQNKFEYAFLNNLVSETDGTLAQKYKRLTVRSSGNDNGFGFIRSEMTCALAAEAGFPDVMYADPVTVYINGDYRGIYWLENGYDAQYFENRYGEYTGEFVVLEGSDQRKIDSEEDTEQQYVDEFNEIYQKFSTMDLTIDKNYRELQQFIDVENYLKYFAIENYAGNFDWPNNNVKVYRYIAQDGNYTEDSVFDGRYRCLLNDMDYCFGLLCLNDTIGIWSGKCTLERIFSEDTPLFRALMEREDCRQYFVNYTCDLMYGAMSAENVSEILMRMHSSREKELRYMLEKTTLLEEEIWDWESSIGSYDNVDLNLDRIIQFSISRPQTVLQDMANHFDIDCESLYVLNLHTGGYCSAVQVNGIYVDDEEFSGTFFSNVPVTLKPCISRNERFAYWVVNESIREEEELQLGADDVKEQTIHVELVVEEVDEPVLQINALRAKGTSDFIELINFSRKPVSTSGYFLSDSEDYYKYELPTLILQPGETRRFYGKDCMDVEGLGEIGLNFNLKRDEKITLTHGTQVIEELCIPNLSEGGIYRRDANTGKFKEEKS